MIYREKKKKKKNEQWHLIARYLLMERPIEEVLKGLLRLRPSLSERAVKKEFVSDSTPC